MPNINDANPGDIWKHLGVEYRIENTGLLKGSLKTEDMNSPLVMVYSQPGEHPLYFVMLRKEFLEKFRFVRKGDK